MWGRCSLFGRLRFLPASAFYVHDATILIFDNRRLALNRVEEGLEQGLGGGRTASSLARVSRAELKAFLDSLLGTNRAGVNPVLAGLTGS